jgi:hypothetical protein
MGMPKDLWLRRAEESLLSILFRGYHTKQTDPAMLYRMETIDAERVGEVLDKLFDLAQPKPAAPAATTKGPT